ncbi:MAG: hypothetical protein KKD39_07765 [Candidatus Altiarchaeota archaeon]|nr:hypothetical protein [Candidatus Altiarchaeota archaeon]
MGEQERGNFNWGLFLPGIAAALICIVLFSGTPRGIYNNGDYQQWSAAPLSDIDLVKGISNAAAMLVYVSVYGIGLILLTNGKKRIDQQVKAEYRLIAIYLLFSFLMSYPLAFQSRTHLPGDVGDEYRFIWYLNWGKKSFLGFMDPFHTDTLAYPVGTSLIFAEAMFPVSIISIPVQLISGVIFTYNFLVFASMVFSGYGIYKLVRYLTGDYNAAAISGLAAAVMPYRFAHLVGHLNLITTQWLILYIYFFTKAMGERKKFDTWMSVLFLTITAYTGFTYLFFAGVYTGAYLLWKLIVSFFNKRGNSKALNEHISVFTIVATTTLILSAPLMYLVVSEYGLFEHPDRTFESVINSADLFAYVTPPSFNPLLGPYVAGVEGKFSSFVSERTVYLGWSILLAAAYGVYQLIKSFKIDKKNDMDMVFWVFFGLFCFLLSLGPYLHVLGDVREDITLPYEYITNMPVLSIAKTPVRYSLIVAMAAIISAGYGLSRIKCKSKMLVYYVLITLVVVEYLPIPYITNRAPNPEWAIFLRDKPGDIVYELPGSTYSEYFQVYHDKTRLQGRLGGRMPKKTEEYTSGVDRDSKSMGAYFFVSKYKIDYFVVHKQKIDSLKNTLEYLSSEFGNPMYSDNDVIVYDTREKR